MTDYRKRLEAGVAKPAGPGGIIRIKKSDLRSLLSEADAAVGRAMTSNAHKNETERLLIAEREESARLRALVEEAGKVVVPLVTFMSDAEALQNSPHRGGWGVECALCMGELVEAGEKLTLDAARSLLPKLKGEGQ